MYDKRVCWILYDAGKVGTVNQCLGLANALSLEPTIFDLSISNPLGFYLTSPTKDPVAVLNYIRPSLRGDSPKLIIAGGRVAVKVAAALKTLANPCTIVLQNPRLPLDLFDVVVAPAHDRIKGENVIETLGAPNLLTESRLQAAAQHFAPHLKGLPHPWVFVVLGGGNKYFKLGPSEVKKLATQLRLLQNMHGGTYLLTTSRRTGSQNTECLRQELEDCLNPGTWKLWSGEGENPYLGYLGLADHIVVTADSISMVSEACFTGKPVYLYQLPAACPYGLFPHKFHRFHNQLIETQRLRLFAGKLEDWTYEPLRESERVAQLIDERLLKGFSI